MRISDWISDVCSSDLQGQPALGHRRQSTQILCNPGSGRTAAPGAAPLSQRPGWSGPMIPPELLAPFQIGVLFLLIAIALAVFIAETDRKSTRLNSSH